MQLDELDKLDKNHPHMNYNPFAVSHKHKKHSSVMVRVADY